MNNLSMSIIGWLRRLDMGPRNTKQPPTGGAVAIG
jgi:hypothetical protein